MNEYSLKKYPSSRYLEEFNSKDFEIIPHQKAGLYRFQNGLKTKIEHRSPGNRMTQPEKMHHRGIIEIYLHEDIEHAYCDIGPEDRTFGVRLKTDNGRIPDTIMDIAREIISQIVEMDTEVRDKTNNSHDDYEEQLSFINISHNEVELHYAATTVNTEWGAYFQKDEDGKWNFKGLG